MEGPTQSMGETHEQVIAERFSVRICVFQRQDVILDLSPMPVDSKNIMTAVICTGQATSVKILLVLEAFFFLPRHIGNTFCLMDVSEKTQFSLISHFIY